MERLMWSDSARASTMSSMISPSPMFRLLPWWIRKPDRCRTAASSRRRRWKHSKQRSGSSRDEKVLFFGNLVGFSVTLHSRARLCNDKVAIAGRRHYRAQMEDIPAHVEDESH